MNVARLKDFSEVDLTFTHRGIMDLLSLLDIYFKLT